MDISEDDLFDDIERSALDDEDVTETDKPLGRAYDDDHGDELYEPAEKIDVVENRCRGTSYEATPGRSRTGHDGELDLSRVNLDSDGKAHGDGSGGDWDGNISTRVGHTAMDGTGYFSDTRGGSSYTGGHEDVDPEVQEEFSEAGLRLGINSVDMNSAAFCLINARYMKNKIAWAKTPPWKRELINEERRDKRANRGASQVREDSIHRHASEIYRRFIRERTEDDRYWEFLDPEQIDQMNGVDSRSARQMAERWKIEDDQRRLDAMIVRYAAALERIQPRSIQTRFRRKPELRQAAEIVFVCDAHACDVVMPGGFDRDRLLSQWGDELYELDTPLTDQERREAIIEEAHDYYASGALFPAYVLEPLMPMLNEVAALLEQAGVDLSPLKPEIDWSRV